MGGLDPSFRRLGLGQAEDGTLYEGYFVKNGSAGTAVGTVGSVTLSVGPDGGWVGTEVPLLTGLEKPVGVVPMNGNLYVTDQGSSDFVVVPIASLPTSTPQVLASGYALDLLSQGPNGLFFTGSSVGDLYALTADGGVEVLATGYANPRGSAYDSVNNRVFFGNHIQSGGTNQLVIVPGP